MGSLTLSIICFMAFTQLNATNLNSTKVIEQSEKQIEDNTITTVQIKKFLAIIIPNLYRITDGEILNIEDIKPFINPTIISNQEKKLEPIKENLKKEGVRQTAEVKGFNADGLTINFDKKMAFLEAGGNITLVSKEKTKAIPIIWKCFLTLTPKTKDNPTGITLYNIVEETNQL